MCLSPQEWAAPLPTNRQQIMRRAGLRGHEVLFVETSDFVGKDIVRLVRGPGRRSLLRRLVRGEAVEPGVVVRRALNVLPWGQRYRLSDRVNGRLGAAVVGRAARRLPAPRVAWLYDPRATWAVGRLGEAFAVYDCVDDYAEQAAGARNRALVAAADERAARVSRLVFTTTRGLLERHARTNPRTTLVRNVGDFAHFAPAADRAAARPDVAGLPHPVIGFSGNILAGKLDLSVLEELADRRRDWWLLVAGPADAALGARVAELARRPNVTWVGPVPYEEMPSVVAAFDVGLIPYEANDYTRNVFPLKLYEYLAAGKPVVALGLPELEGMEPDVVVAGDVTAAEAAIERALGDTDAVAVARRQDVASASTWDTRTERLLALVDDELARS